MHRCRMRFLFSVKAGSLGHLLPLVPLARAAAGAGHEVVFASGPDRADAVEGLGFRFRPVGLAFADALAERRRRWPDWPWGDLVHTFSKVFTMIQAPAALPDLERVVDEERPDVIVWPSTTCCATPATASRRTPSPAKSPVCPPPPSCANSSWTGCPDRLHSTAHRGSTRFGDLTR